MMAFHHRKLLDDCNYYSCIFPPPEYPKSSPPPPPFHASSPPNKTHPLSPFVILMFCFLGAVFLVVSYLTFVKRYYSNWNTSRRRNPSTFDDDQEDFVNENHGPVIDHHIWYINTVGLQQSVIDSIAVFKYKRDEGLIEGTDCSVCLSEFQVDETLRLLPKCSHAFHISCIDTWLRSHKNCPLCRAPIFSDANTAQASASEPNLDHLGSREDIPVDDSENYGGLGSHQVGGVELGVGTENFGVLPSEEGGAIAGILNKDSSHFNTKNFEFRVLSDLADRRPKVEEELQPVRRSISMDASSASRIYLAVANIPHQVEVVEGCSSTDQLVKVKKQNSVANKVVNRNLSISRVLMKSPSVRRSLQKGPVIDMKRSFSTSGKFSLPRRYSRSQDSILPL